MKDRFVKVMLVVIAGLLFLNCIRQDAPSGVSDFFAPTAFASSPPFLTVGKSYRCSNGINQFTIKVTKIDTSSGWIAEGDAWFNTATMHGCEALK